MGDRSYDVVKQYVLSGVCLAVLARLVRLVISESIVVRAESLMQSHT
jgi:hypothetical protein